MLLEMEVTGLALDPSSNTPILILKTKGSESGEEERTLPIWIGLLEAASIAMALQGVEFHRPMTHDLFKAFLDSVSAKVEKVEVTELKDNTYFARIHFATEGGSFSMDARPSDAIAMALRAQCPIFAEDDVITKSTTVPPPGQPEDTSEEGKKWAEYLESLDPDAFTKV
ncbi:MAG: bifunctional nuclease family protein [Deltaproteobacteria bacterium]|nr:bifunctional nuclease family protein [Deltaproteobacteria bacterium]